MATATVPVVGDMVLTVPGALSQVAAPAVGMTPRIPIPAGLLYLVTAVGAVGGATTFSIVPLAGGDNLSQATSYAVLQGGLDRVYKAD